MSTNRSLMIIRLIPLLLLFSLNLQANPRDEYIESDEHNWQVTVLLDVGDRKNPLIGQPKLVSNVELLPTLQYYGEKFFFDDELGYTLHSTDRLMVSLIASPALDFFLFNDSVFEIEDIEELDGLEERMVSLDGGIEILYDFDWGEVEFQIETDLFAVHDGQLAEFNYAYTFRFFKKRLEFRPQVGLVWKSDNYVDYYYGISAEEARVGLPEYEGKAGLDWIVRFDTKYSLTREWHVVSSLYYEKGHEGITDSPIVERDYYLEYFVGIEWTRPFSIVY